MEYHWHLFLYATTPFPFQKFPAYYVVIKRPIDLKTIATKIQEAGYISLDALEADLQLMVKNAKTFNEPRSLIYRVGTLHFNSPLFL